MGLWDKSKVLDAGARLDETYETGTPFILYGMKVAGEVDLENGLPPATKTVMLTEEAAITDGGQYGTLRTREAVVVGTLSGPIAEMASQATPDDFPVVVSWERKQTKAEREATVLNFLGEWEGDTMPDEIPAEWTRF